MEHEENAIRISKEFWENAAGMKATIIIDPHSGCDGNASYNTEIVIEDLASQISFSKDEMRLTDNVVIHSAGSMERDVLPSLFRFIGNSLESIYQVMDMDSFIQSHKRGKRQ